MSNYDRDLDVSKNKELQIRGELQTGHPLLITKDNQGIFISKMCITNVVGIVSKIYKKKLDNSTTTEIIDMLHHIDPTPFIGRHYKWSINKIANNFVNQRNFRKEQAENPIPEPSYRDIQFNQLMNMSDNEHQYKYTAHTNRQGGSINPDNYVNGVRRSHIDPMDTLGRFLDPQNIDELFNRPRSFYMDFNNITLPHTSIIFDSRYRNRLWSYSNEIQWLIQSTNDEGSIGDIRLRDTLVEVIYMKICPFWIPHTSNKDDYYDKVFMGIKEFKNQSTHMTEFLGPEEKNTYSFDYHFEFDVLKVEKDRLYLNPVCNTFIFRKPMARIESITVEFRHPFQQIFIQEDHGIFTITPGNPTLFSGPIHNLATGDLVYILNFNSGTSTDNIINQVQGHYIVLVNSTEFFINIDTTALFSDPVTVVYGSKRIFFKLEFISLEH